MPIHQERKFQPLRIAVLTVSDTRTLADDRSGDVLVQRLTSAGHHLVSRDLVADRVEEIVAEVRRCLAADQPDAIICTGGTGITGRDVTPEALRQLFSKELPGFGELFRMLSYAKIGSSAMQSRAVAGVVHSTYLFALPGSPSAVADAWDGILVEQLDTRNVPCSLAELIPRLGE